MPLYVAVRFWNMFVNDLGPQYNFQAHHYNVQALQIANT